MVTKPQVTPAIPDDLSSSQNDLWKPAFPSADLVQVAAGMFASLAPDRGDKGLPIACRLDQARDGVDQAYTRDVKLRRGISRQYGTLCRKCGKTVSSPGGLQEYHDECLPGSNKLVHDGSRRGVIGEGPRYYIAVGPGVLAIQSKDAAKAERAYQRAVKRQQEIVRELSGHLVSYGELPVIPGSRREITGWSRKSRARMVRRLCELDYAPMFSGKVVIPIVITLTYPGDWETVAPNGKAVKAHFDKFRKRWARAWGSNLICIWKLEFQERGAPHIHALTTLPLGNSADGRTALPWIKENWADIVDHPDPEQRRRNIAAGVRVDFVEGLRARDPRRVAVYFLKHGVFKAKEYQHIVPELWRAPGQGPGRFWGYQGLDPCVAMAEVDSYAAVDIARIMRRWANAQRTTHEIRAPRTKGGVARRETSNVKPSETERLGEEGEIEPLGLSGMLYLDYQAPTRTRKVRRRVRRMKYGRGWVAVNDGPAFASAIARHLDPVKDVF